MCKVSVIVPCYGVEAYLDRCMASLLTQTLDDIEIIMVDDGSPDRVPFMCDDYAKKDSRIKIIHKENGGLGYARNSGLDLATGEYVVFIDSDDYIESDAFEKMYNEAKRSQADAVFSGFYIQNKQGLWEEHIENSESKIMVGTEIDEFKLGMIACAPYEKAERYFWVSVWHALYKRDLIENIIYVLFQNGNMRLKIFLFRSSFLAMQKTLLSTRVLLPLLHKWRIFDSFF